VQLISEPAQWILFGEENVISPHAHALPTKIKATPYEIHIQHFPLLAAMFVLILIMHIMLIMYTNNDFARYHCCFHAKYYGILCIL